MPDLAEHWESPFSGAALPQWLRWHCEPAKWSLHAVGGDDSFLRIEPDAATDFWRRTHYGFEADNGHFLFAEVAGDFVFTVRVQFWPVHQYDQAGVMIRATPDCWLKASVEFEPSGPSQLGAVVTNHGFSDWSTQQFPPGAGSIWLRVRRETDDYLVDASDNGVKWDQIRLTHLHGGQGGSIACGIYACSPKGAGFRADFDRFAIIRGRL